MVDFGDKLKRLRKEKRLTQSQLANRIGITKSVVSAYESASRYPSYTTLIKIAIVFGVSTDYLLGLEKGPAIDISGLSDGDAAAIMKLVDSLKSK